MSLRPDYDRDYDGPAFIPSRESLDDWCINPYKDRALVRLIDCPACPECDVYTVLEVSTGRCFILSNFEKCLAYWYKHNHHLKDKPDPYEEYSNAEKAQIRRAKLFGAS